MMHRVERETGFEPATACLAGRGSTTELLPLTAGFGESIHCNSDMSRSGRPSTRFSP